MNYLLDTQSIHKQSRQEKGGDEWGKRKWEQLKQGQVPNQPTPSYSPHPLLIVLPLGAAQFHLKALPVWVCVCLCVCGRALVHNLLPTRISCLRGLAVEVGLTACVSYGQLGREHLG